MPRNRIQRTFGASCHAFLTQLRLEPQVSEVQYKSKGEIIHFDKQFAHAWFQAARQYESIHLTNSESDCKHSQGKPVDRDFAANASSNLLVFSQNLVRQALMLAGGEMERNYQK
jgi:hypothetical protein